MCARVPWSDDRGSLAINTARWIAASWGARAGTGAVRPQSCLTGRARGRESFFFLFSFFPFFFVIVHVGQDEGWPRAAKLGLEEFI